MTQSNRSEAAPRGGGAAPVPQRNLTIDVVKGLGIVLVVFGHNWLVLDDKAELYRVIFSFHIPLFLLVSGLFIKPAQSLPGLVKDKADGLLKPYLVVLGVLGLAKAAVHPGGALNYFAGMFYATGDTLSWVPMWFLPHLFLGLILAWALLRLGAMLRFPAWGWVPLLWVLGAWSLGWFWQRPLPAAGAALLGMRLMPGLPWSADLLPLSTAFLLLGHVLQAPIKSLAFRPLPWLVALVGFAALHIAFNDTIDLNMRQYDHWLVSTLQIVLGVALVILSSAWLARRSVGRVLARLGAASLFILMFHMVVQDRVFMVLNHVTGQPVPSAVAAFLLGVTVPVLLQAVVVRQRWLARLLLPLPRTRAPATPNAAVQHSTGAPGKGARA